MYGFVVQLLKMRCPFARNIVMRHGMKLLQMRWEFIFDSMLRYVVELGKMW